MVERTLFRLDGEYWTLSYDGTTVRVKDVKGLRDIARLVADRGTRIPVADLVGERCEGARSGERLRTAVAMRIRFALQKIERVHPTLGSHLRSAIQTGVSCVYLPSEPVQWEV